jgi:hypothetical protein
VEESPEARGLTEEERREWVRKRRAFARTYGGSGPFQFTQIVARYYVVVLRAGALFIFAILALRPLIDPNPRGFRVADYVVGLVLGLLLLTPVVVMWQRERRITRAVSALCSVMGGSWGKDRFMSVLDWLDAHWRDAEPVKLLDLPGLFEDRWDVQTAHRARPVLVMVRRRWATKHLPGIQRVSFFLSAPRAERPPGYDEAPALRELQALGFLVRQTHAGVYAYSFGIKPEMLDPGRINRALDVAISLTSP